MGKIRFTITFCVSKCGKLLRLQGRRGIRFLPLFRNQLTVNWFRLSMFQSFPLPVPTDTNMMRHSKKLCKPFLRKNSKNFLTLIWIEICYYRARFYWTQKGCKMLTRMRVYVRVNCAIRTYVKFARICEQTGRAKKFAFFGSNCSKIFERCKHICKLRKRFQVSNRLAWI